MMKTHKNYDYVDTRRSEPSVDFLPYRTGNVFIFVKGSSARISFSRGKLYLRISNLYLIFE